MLECADHNVCALAVVRALATCRCHSNSLSFTDVQGMVQQVAASLDLSCTRAGAGVGGRAEQDCHEHGHAMSRAFGIAA